MTNKENEMNTTTDQIEAAADALRQHLHDRPWEDEPQAIYYAISDLTDLLHRTAEALEQAVAVAGRAVQSDDGNLADHVQAAQVRLRRAREAALNSAGHLRLAHNATGHLIWS